MRIDWNAPIPMDDGIVLRADIFRPIAEGKYPVILTYGIYAKGLSYPGRLSHAVGEDGHRSSGDPGGLDQQVSELGGHRSRALGAAWLRRGPRGFARRRLVSGLHGSQLPARDRRPLPVHRVGGHAALEQRQGRHAGHLLLLHQPVASGGQASAASGRDHPLGGPQRLLPRQYLSRRHSVGVPEALGEAPGGEHSVRTGREGQEEPEHRRVHRRPDHTFRRGAGQEPRRCLRGDQEASAVSTSGTARAPPISRR